MSFNELCTNLVILADAGIISKEECLKIVRGYLELNGGLPISTFIKVSAPPIEEGINITPVSYSTKKDCEKEGCDTKSSVKGLCANHYAQMLYRKKQAKKMTTTYTGQPEQAGNTHYCQYLRCPDKESKHFEKDMVEFNGFLFCSDGCVANYNSAEDVSATERVLEKEVIL